MLNDWSTTYASSISWHARHAGLTFSSRFMLPFAFSRLFSRCRYSVSGSSLLSGCVDAGASVSSLKWRAAAAIYRFRKSARRRTSPLSALPYWPGEFAVAPHSPRLLSHNLMIHFGHEDIRRFINIIMMIAFTIHIRYQDEYIPNAFSLSTRVQHFTILISYKVNSLPIQIRIARTS